MPVTAPRDRWPSKFWIAVRIVVTALILFYLARQVASGWAQVRSLFSQLRLVDGLASLLAAVAAYQCLLLGWLVLLRRLGLYRSRHAAAYVRIWWISYFYRYVPGKALIVVERARLGAAVGIPASIGATLAVVETAVAVLAALWVSVLALGFHGVGGRQTVWLTALLSLFVLLLVPIAYGFLRTRAPMRRWFPALAGTALRPLDLLAALPLYLLHYVLIGVSFFFCTRSIGSFTWDYLPEVCGVYALSHAAGVVTLVSPGGLGVREAALGLQLARRLPAGVGAALAIGARVWFTLIEAVTLVAVLALTAKLESSREGCKPNG